MYAAMKSPQSVLLLKDLCKPGVLGRLERYDPPKRQLTVRLYGVIAQKVNFRM